MGKGWGEGKNCEPPTNMPGEEEDPTKLAQIAPRAQIAGVPVLSPRKMRQTSFS